jgi:hypothetical protein
MLAETGERYGSVAISNVMKNPDARRKVMDIAERVMLMAGIKQNKDPGDVIDVAVATAVEEGAIGSSPSDAVPSDGALVPSEVPLEAELPEDAEEEAVPDESLP